MTMTYTSLTNQILSYLNRSDADTINQIPNFIYQAEQRICREVKSIGIETYVTNSFTPSVNTFLKPARWRRTLSFQVGIDTNNNTRFPLFLRTYDYLRQYWPDDSITGQPIYYADYGYDHFIIAPTPDISYPFELSYMELPEPIGPTVSTNWITNNAPDLLLYASLLEAVPYLKVDQRAPLWQSYYDRALQSLNAQDEQRYQDRQSNRKAD